ncbi:hypothetical protein [Sporosarcina globispora]|uniref:hypothetical protein n=1 Tax=Sporosarcina globispora TaxID=1459 RepID=UPI000A5CB537|nr:hypothetical protein [Sporosarcina globispora]
MKNYEIKFQLMDGLTRIVKLQAISKHDAMETALLDNDLDDLGISEIKITVL